MKFDPPRLTRGPLSGRVFVVTHGKELGEGRIEASCKYDVTEQFDALAVQAAPLERFQPSHGGSTTPEEG